MLTAHGSLGFLFAQKLTNLFEGAILARNNTALVAYFIQETTRRVQVGNLFEHLGGYGALVVTVRLERAWLVGPRNMAELDVSRPFRSLGASTHDDVCGKVERKEVDRVRGLDVP